MRIELSRLVILILSMIFSLAAFSAVPNKPAGIGHGPAIGYVQSSSQNSRVIERIRSRTGPGEAVRVIIGMADGFVPVGQLNGYQRNKQDADIRKKKRKVQALLPGGKFVVRQQYQRLPFMALEIDSAELGKLLAIPEITSIEEDRLSRPALASSNLVIGSPDAWSAGYNGAGSIIAVLDTGVEKTHPYFSTFGKVVAEACFSTNNRGQGGVSACPGGVEFSTAPGSGGPCSTSDCNHGTTVAGVAAGNDFIGPNFGVARGADLIAIQVYTDFQNTQLCGTSSPCSLSYASDQIAALEHVYSLSGSYDIAAVNMSLGDGNYSGYCDSSEYGRKAAIDNLRSIGIPTIIASGNGHSRNSMQSPACISSAISVAATTDSDFIANFSNVSITTSLLAPGVSITASTTGGGERTLSGTSLAAPHVAGAWAILKGKNPEASVDDVLQDLYLRGVEIDDTRSGGVVTGMRRISLMTALEPDPPQDVPAVSGTYVGVKGCRLVDTRLTGLAMTPLVEYQFLAGKSGQNLLAQGGAGAGCNLPQEVSAIQVNFTVIAEGTSGYIRAWQAGQLEPNATVFSWNGGNTTNALILPVCAAPACPSDFIVKLYLDNSGVDLVIDLFGYFIK